MPKSIRLILFFLDMTTDRDKESDNEISSSLPTQIMCPRLIFIRLKILNSKRRPSVYTEGIYLIYWFWFNSFQAIVNLFIYGKKGS